jgi:polyphenol oxidase
MISCRVNDRVCIYFGGKAASLCVSELYTSAYAGDMLMERCTALTSGMSVKSLVALRQTHSNKGLIIADAVDIPDPYEVVGDYVVTHLMGYALTIITADCLPIVMYDPFQKVVALIHAGWKGSVVGVAAQAVFSMQRAYGTAFSDVKVFFGPSAQKCCYEVREDFVARVKSSEIGYVYEGLFEYRCNDTIYFDLALYNYYQLRQLGVVHQNFILEYQRCTICDDTWCSSRRDQSTKRQVTMVVLES